MTSDGNNGSGNPRRSDGGADEAAAVRPRHAPPADTFTWRGWVLVAMVVVAFFLIPGAILVLPSAQGVVGSLGLTLRDAYLVLPLPAAILLGAIAVWSALTSRGE
ncbi:MAG: hypothetical protein ABEH64_12770 [Salinirussus sp.]